MLNSDIVEQAKQADVIKLAEQATTLINVSGSEWAGPCPKCGGDDRFHVKADGWFCRQCQPIDTRHGWHTAIDFVMWRQGVTFAEAVTQLTNGKITEDHQVYKRNRKLAKQPSAWRPKAEQMVEEAHSNLLAQDGDTREYLLSRGIEPHVWLAFRLGSALARNPDSGAMQPAIVLPWYSGGKLTAIKYRFLKAECGKQKMSSYTGSRFKDRLYGGHAFAYHGEPQDQQAARDLLICEGELNAVSIWQAHSQCGIDTLSLGSESAKLPDAFIPHAQKYARVLIWMDEGEKARDAMKKLPGAHGIRSPKAQDANDLLQAGLLAAFLTMVRLQAAQDADRKCEVRDAITDWQRSPNGQDARVARILERET